jgi:hypothetical protein
MQIIEEFSNFDLLVNGLVTVTTHNVAGYRLPSALKKSPLITASSCRFRITFLTSLTAYDARMKRIGATICRIFVQSHHASFVWTT